MFAMQIEWQEPKGQFESGEKEKQKQKVHRTVENRGGVVENNQTH